MPDGHCVWVGGEWGVREWFPVGVISSVCHGEGVWVELNEWSGVC